MGYQTIEVERIAGSLGAEIRGLDLRQGLSDLALSELNDALLRHHVVFLRDQPLDDEQHVAFARRFGPLSVYPLLKVQGIEEPLETIADSADSPPKADHWHTDVTWLVEPPMIAILSAREIPPYGGDTVWANLHAAYDALSPVMQTIVEGLTVFHDAGDAFWAGVARAMGPGRCEELRGQVGAGAEHPLVRTHPVTGRKALFVAGYFMDHIVGMESEESRLLLDFLMRHATQERFQCRWRWRVDDLAIWDERCTLHHALADHYPQRRVVRRCTVDGERPYFDPNQAPA